MADYRRINVDSGRPLEPLANYSRAMRVGDMVLQSGTTAIDKLGNVIGEGDIAKQVDAIMAIAEGTMGQAGGMLDDVVRTRVYVTDIALADQAGRAMAKYFKDVRPAATLVQVSRLARPTQLTAPNNRRNGFRRAARRKSFTPIPAPCGLMTESSSQARPALVIPVLTMRVISGVRLGRFMTRFWRHWIKPVAGPAIWSIPNPS
jgi:enamine deaminase RidA (YjgF/YER057c/UK114 family)